MFYLSGPPQHHQAIMADTSRIRQRRTDIAEARTAQTANRRKRGHVETWTTTAEAPSQRSSKIQTKIW